VALDLKRHTRLTVSLADQLPAEIGHVSPRIVVEFIVMLLQNRVDGCKQQCQRRHPLLAVNELQHTAGNRIRRRIESDDRA
jgi:hypothetical protein